MRTTYNKQDEQLLNLCGATNKALNYKNIQEAAKEPMR